MKEYYYTIDDKQFGPFSLEELLTKGINSNTYVWCAGMAEWQIASEVLSEFQNIPAPPPIPNTTSTSDAKIETSSSKFDLKGIFGRKGKVIAGVSGVVLMLLIFSSNTSFSSYDCSSNAYTAAQTIMNDQFDGGVNLKVVYSNCQEVKGGNTMDIEFSFNGNIIRSNYYEVHGELFLTDNNTYEIKYKRLNDAAKGYVAMNGLINSAMLLEQL